MTDLVVARRYRLGRRIGVGGMGRVWLAMDEVLRRQVAVKEVLLPEGLTDDDAAELRLRTLREARTAGKVSHPNVIKVYDVIYAEDRPWIVMEYVASRSLAQVIREDGPMSPERAARIGLAILSALVAAHEAGVLHRDVKPGNVLLGDTRVVLTDFGLATFDDIGSALTASGVVHGSPQFIAPERALDGTSTVAADMWSLGATLYAAVEGRAPYARASSYATLTALATAPPDPPKHAGALKPVLHGLLRRNPASRMGADEVRAWLEQIVDSGIDNDSGRSRIPQQRRYADPDSGGSNSSVRSEPRPPTRSPGTPPVSHARRNRRPGPTSPSGRGRAPAPDPPSRPAARNPSTDLPVAGSAPPATGSALPPIVASGQARLVQPPDGLERDTDHQMDLAWQLDAAAGVLGRHASQEIPAGTGTGRGSGWVRSRRTRWIASVLCVMAAATAGAFGIRAVRSGHTGFPIEQITTPGSTGLSGNGSATTALTWPCPAKPLTLVAITVPPLGPGDPTTYRGYALLPGWRWLVVDGFEAAAPIGWLQAHHGDVTCFYEPGTSRVLGYESIEPAGGSLTAELKAEAATLVSIPGWAKVKSAPIEGDPDALGSGELDYSYVEGPSGQTIAMDALVYMILAKPDQARAYCFTAADLGWSNPNGITNMLQASMLVAK